MNSATFTHRLSSLETRLDQIEAALRERGILPSPPPVIRSEPSAPQPGTEPQPQVQPPPMPEVQPVPPPLVIAPMGQWGKASAPRPQPVERLDYPRAQPVTPVPQSDIEKTIGLKWAGWIGAIVFVIGAVLGVKYIYDQGWLSNVIPDWLWLSLIALGGFALVGAGEWVFRHVNRLSAVGLYAAGVATLFIAGYVGHSYYEIYSSGTAFTLMALAAIVGSAVAMRGNLLSIAVLSLLGANVAPLLLRGVHSPLVSFLTYLLAMQVVALVLAAWGRRGKWWTLRGLSLLMLSGWMTSIIADAPGAAAVLVFTILFAALYHLEMIVSNLIRTEPARREGAAGLAFGTIVTAALTGALLWINQDAGELVRMFWVLGLAAACGAIAAAITAAKRLDGLLAASYGLQAVGLLLLSIPVGFSGVNVEVGWAMMAVVLAIIAALSGRPIASATALAAWMLAAAHLAMRALDRHELAVTLTIAGDAIDTRALAAIALAAVGHLVAILTTRRNQEGLAGAGQIVVIVSGVMWCAAAMHQLQASAATIMMLALAWIMVVEDRLAQSLRLRVFAEALLVMAAAKWAVYDSFILRFARSAPVMPVMFNLQMLNAILLVGSAVATLRSLAAQDTAHRGIRTALKVAIALVSLLSLSFEIDRWFGTAAASSRFINPRLAEQMAFSIFWACFAVGTVGVGFRLREAALRYFGLALLAITLLKVVFVDLSGVSQGYRILSFIGVGILMLGTSVLYGKLSPRLLREDSERSVQGS